MSTELDEDIGFDVTDDVEVGDLSTQVGNDVIEAFPRVLFEIRRASVRDYIKQGETVWRKKFLSLDLVIAEGVNDEGKYRNKHMFQDLLLIINVDAFPDLNTDHYKQKGRYDLKVFLKAMGFDPAAPPRINDEFVSGLVGRMVIGDIQKRSIDNPPAEEGGKWTPSGQFKNEVRNFRAV